MRKAQKMLAVILAVLLLVSSGVSGITTAFAVEGKSTEAATEQTTEGHKVAQKVEPETALQTRSGSGPETESETKQTETETQTQKETEPETKKPAETESEEPETKKPANEKPSKPAANEPVSDVKAPKESGVSISSPDDADLATLVPDPNFRQAIYDNFGNANWLAGDPKNPPSATDESGNPRSRIEILKEILGTYTGNFSAVDCNIEDIRGIRYLKLVGTGSRYYSADFRGNKITSLMPLVDLDNPRVAQFGRYSYDDEIFDNVDFNFADNPIRVFPETLNQYYLGYLKWSSMNDNIADIVNAGNGSKPLNFYYLRNKAERFNGFLRVNYCTYNEEYNEETKGKNNKFVELSRLTLNGQDIVYYNNSNNSGINSRSSRASGDSTDIIIDKTAEGLHKDENVDVSYSNLAKSVKCSIGVYTIKFIKAYTLNAGAGGPNDDTYSYSYSIKPSFVIYDKLKIDGNARGSAQVLKTDDTTGLPLKGAEFDLYREGEKDPIKTGLVTDEKGYTEKATELPMGNYYFVETKAPEGYEISKEKYPFYVGYSSEVSGGFKNLDLISADDSEIHAVAEKKQIFITKGMDKDVNFYLNDAAGKNVGKGEDIVQNVVIHYESLNGKEGVTEECGSLAEAENLLNGQIDNNEITGAVSVDVTYNEDAIATVTVEAQNSPAVNVQIDKTWKGIGADDTDLPEVNYTLYRTKKSGEKETVGECKVKVLVAGKEETVTVTDGKVTIPADSPKENYKCTYIDLPKYEKSSDGTYVTNDDGKLYAYKYFAEEEITQEEDGKYEKEGDVGEASDPVEQDDGTELITIPVTNYRKGKVKIQKSDSSQQREDLSGVRFKLEQEVTKNGVTSWDEVETGTTDAKGALEFKWLSWGKYRLTETQTWDGYILLQDPIVFEVKKEEIQDPNDFVYMIPNDYKFSVPRSGGIGSFWFLVSGSLLILIGGLWAYKRRFCIK